MSTSSRTTWHPIFQDILSNHLDLLSGKVLITAKWEETHNLYNDFVCEMNVNAPNPYEDIQGIRPFDHLKKVNLFEYKSLHQSVNDQIFRDMVGRSLQYERLHPTGSRGSVTANLVTTREPVKLLRYGGYPFEKLNSWKYRCEPILDLEAYIIYIPGMRFIKGGDPMAMLQVLDGAKEVRLQNFRNILQQELAFERDIRRLLSRVDREGIAMTVWDKAIQDGFLEGQEIGEAKGFEKGIEQGLEKGIEQGLEKGIEQGLEKGIEQGLEQGTYKGDLSARLEIAKSLLKTKLAPNTIADAVNLPLQQILQLE